MLGRKARHDSPNKVYTAVNRLAQVGTANEIVAEGAAMISNNPKGNETDMTTATDPNPFDDMPTVKERETINRDILEGKYFVTYTHANDESRKMQTCGRIVKRLTENTYYIERVTRGDDVIFGEIVYLAEMHDSRYQFLNDKTAWAAKVKAIYDYGLID